MVARSGANVVDDHHAMHSRKLHPHDEKWRIVQGLVSIAAPHDGEPDSLVTRRASTTVSPMSNPGRILLVDDEDAVRRVAARMLRHAGYDVATASDGQEAVDMIRAEPARFDLVVLDGNTPRMNGLHAAQLIREIRADLPLVLASGYFDGSKEEMLAREIFSGVIAKPYDIASLSSAIAALLRNAD